MNYSYRFTFINGVCSNSSRLIESTFSRAYMNYAWCAMRYVNIKLHSDICDKRNSRIKRSNLSSDVTRRI